MPHSIKDSIIGAHLHADAHQRSDRSIDFLPENAMVNKSTFKLTMNR